MLPERYPTRPAAALLCLAALAAAPLGAQPGVPAAALPELNLSPDRPGILEPMMSAMTGRDVRAPHTLQVDGDGRLANLLSHVVEPIGGTAPPPLSATGHPIERASDPHRDLHAAAARLARAAGLGDTDALSAAAGETLDILLGRTRGRIYDGFPLLNFNRWNSDLVGPEHFSPDAVPGEYKLKMIRPARDAAGRWIEEPCWHERTRTCHVWEVDVRHLWYGHQFDSDTFLIGIPYRVEVDGETVVVDQNDTLRINWHVYSLVEEDLAPTQVLRDALLDLDVADPDRSGTVRLPYKGQDTVWRRIGPDTVNHLVVQHTALRLLRGIYTWGWHAHPPRIQFLQPVFQLENVHTGEVEWDWQARSYVHRNRELDLDGIGEAAPEKKLYRVARAALDGAPPEEVRAMLEDPSVSPGPGTWRQWIALMADQRQLPPEARRVLAEEGREIDDYDFITVYLNNELYGGGPLAHTIRSWRQGEVMQVKLINLDGHTHYFRNVGFGPQLSEGYSRHARDGLFSSETMSFKPLYGAPKAIELQWRAGFGFRPGFSIVQQPGLFARAEDRKLLRPFFAPTLGLPLDAAGRKTGVDRLDLYWGYQFANARLDPFPVDPPDFLVETLEQPAFDTFFDLWDAPRVDRGDGSLGYSPFMLDWAMHDPEKFQQRSGEAGLVIGRYTEGWGVAQFCPWDPPGFCREDVRRFHPLGNTNWPIPDDPTKPKNELRFPDFLRNPAQVDFGAGDVIPPTSDWEPFLFLNPANGTLYLDPEDPAKGYWTDLTYAHGRTVYAGQSIDASIEMPRASGQLFYQFDDLFHDNAIFSAHPIAEPSALPGPGRREAR